MNLQQLYYFREIVRCGQYIQAADRLNVTQSSLSHAISDLEQEIGAPLFQRTGRTRELTQIGRIFWEYVEDALDTLDHGRERISELIDPDAGTISIAYLDSIDDFIPKLIAQFYQDTGRLKTKFNFSKMPAPRIEESILKGDVDLGFSTRPSLYDLDCYPIGYHETVVIVSNQHPLASRSTIGLSELEGEKIVTYSYACAIRRYIDDIFQSISIKPNIIAEVLYDHMILGLVAANFGVALIPKMPIFSYYDIKALKIANPIPLRELDLIWSGKRMLSAAALQFKNYLIDKDITFIG